MSHSRKAKLKLPEMFRKKRTYDFENKLGKFEVDEYRDFYVVRKKLTGKNKGLYDPTSMVVAKKDTKIPIFPDRDFARVFGDYNAVMFYWTGVSGKDHFKEEMKRIGISYKALPALKICRMAVNKNHSNKGIGTKMIAFAINIVIEINKLCGCRFLTLEAKNEQNHSQTIEAWSYVYYGSSCLSCSDNESRESNKQKIEIDSNDTETILLENSVKKDIENGDYKLKIKILKEGLKTPKEFTFNITVINSNAIISSNKEEGQIITSNAISNLQNITLANYESKSERNKQLALYLLIFFLLMIIIKKEGFLS